MIDKNAFSGAYFFYNSNGLHMQPIAIIKNIKVVD